MGLDGGAAGAGLRDSQSLCATRHRSNQDEWRVTQLSVGPLQPCASMDARSRARMAVLPGTGAAPPAVALRVHQRPCDLSAAHPDPRGLALLSSARPSENRT